MKMVRIATALIGLLAAAPVFAQTAMDELETARTQIQADRKAIVSKLMDMTEGESAAFWPVYNEYREAVRKVDDQMVSVLKQYGDQEATLTDVETQKLLDQWVGLKGDRVGVQKAHLKKFGKVLPAKKVIRFYQIESKMDAIVQYDLAANIPLIK